MHLPYKLTKSNLVSMKHAYAYLCPHCYGYVFSKCQLGYRHCTETQRWWGFYLFEFKIINDLKTWTGDLEWQAPLSLRMYAVENKRSPTCNSFNLPTSLFCPGMVDYLCALILCKSSYKEVGSPSPLCESGLSLWLTRRMQQKWHNRTSEPLFLGTL